MDNVTEEYDMSWPTDDPDEPCNISPAPAMFFAQTCIHSIICAFGLIGNILVIATYAFYKRTKTMTDVYLLNVAVADLIFVVALPLIVYNEQESWAMGFVACKILRSTYSINLYSGTLLLACISCDRYVAIVWAQRSFGSRSHSLTHSRLICSAVWVFAGVLTLPTLIFTKAFVENEKDVNETATVTCLMHFSSDDTAVLIKLLVPSFQMAIGFLLPLLVMAFCYSCIACTLLRAQNSKRHKALRVVVAVVLVFIVCHLPYNVTLLLHTMSLFKQRDCATEKIKVQVLEISRSVAYLHCCLNPILYAFIGVKFRSHFLQIISDLWCFSRRFVYSPRSSCGASDVCTSGWKISEGSNNVSSFCA